MFAFHTLRTACPDMQAMDRWTTTLRERHESLISIHFHLSGRP